DAFKIAKFYDKEKAYRAAAFYYNEVIREQPRSSSSEQAARRLDQIRAKIGEAALQPVLAAGEQKKKRVASRDASASSKPTLRGGDGEVAPLPPPEQDSALPPPASLMPPTTTAPEPSSAPPAEASPTPEPSASPTP